MANSNEQQWIEQLIQGNEKGFEALYRFYFPKLSQFAYRFVQSTDLAEDIVHDVFLSLWKKKANLKPTKTLRAYLYQAVRNQAMNHLNRQNEDILYDYSLVELISADTADDIELDEESTLQDKVIEAIQQLPDRGRQIYLLHREDGLTYKEIAKVLDISVKTVETHMSRSLAFLREYLSDFLVLAGVALLLAESLI